MERCQKCYQQSLKSKNTTLECYHTFCPTCTNALPFPPTCPICKVAGASPLQCCRCNQVPSNLRAVSLKCRHTVCTGCADETIVNGALTCPSCNVRTFFENEPKKDDEPETEGPSLRRLQSGTYCPQCGANFMKRKARQVNLKCQHLICEGCALDRMIGGALSCPACNKRTFFEPVRSAQPASMDDEDAEPMLRRLQTGTYCPNCGRSFMAKNLKQHTLKCSHLVCDGCIKELCVDGSLQCPTCNKRSFYELPKQHEGELQRRQTGTYCPQCGKSYMSKDMKQVALKCSHTMCERCCDEVCVDGALTCPTCNKRTFFQAVPSAVAASPKEETFTNRMRRLQSGTYCPLCGISFMSRGVNQMSLNCQHQVCQNCVSALVHMNAVSCPVCNATTPLATQLPTQPVYYPQAVAPPSPPQFVGGARLPPGVAPYR